MNGRWVKGRFYIGHRDVDYYFEPCGSHRVRLFEAIEHDSNDRIPTDTIDLTKDEYATVRKLIEAAGLRLTTQPEVSELAEAM